MDVVTRYAAHFCWNEDVEVMPGESCIVPNMTVRAIKQASTWTVLWTATVAYELFVRQHSGEIKMHLEMQSSDEDDTSAVVNN